MRKIIFLLTVVVNIGFACRCYVDQYMSSAAPNSTTDSSTLVGPFPHINIRQYFLSANLGAPELMGFGFGYQNDDNYAFSVRYGVWIIGGGNFLFQGGDGVSVNMTRTSGNRIFNCLNLALMLFNRVSEATGIFPLIKGAGVEISTGYENKKPKTVALFWSLGIMWNSTKGAPPLIAPSIKIGINYNY